MQPESKSMKLASSLPIFLGLSCLAGAPVSAQVVTGTLGEPSATTTIPGNQIPAPPPPFGGVIKETLEGSKTWWPPRIVPPEGRAQRAADHDRRPGLWRQRHLRRRHPDAGARPRRRRPGCATPQFNSTALCSPTRAALITGRNHHSGGFGVITELSTGFPGLRLDHRPGQRDHRPDPQGQRLRHVVVRQEPQHAGLPVQRRRPVRPMAVGHGLRLLLRLHGRRDRPVDAVSVPRTTGRSSRGSASPDYNLTTDMADEAINYMQELKAAAPDSPFFLYYVPGGSHSPHNPTQEWIDKFKGKFDMGWNAMREADLRQPEAPGRDPRERQADRRGRTTCRNGTRCRPTRRSSSPARPRCSPPTPPIPTTRSAA